MITFLLIITHDFYEIFLKSRLLNMLVNFFCHNRENLLNSYSVFHNQKIVFQSVLNSDNCLIYIISFSLQLTKTFTTFNWTVFKSNLTVIVINAWNVILVSIITLVNKNSHAMQYLLLFCMLLICFIEWLHLMMWL